MELYIFKTLTKHPLKRRTLKKLNVSLFSTIGQIKSTVSRTDHTEGKCH